MQQAAAGHVGVLAEVELQLPLHRLRFEPQCALEPVEVALQRHGGGGVRHLSERLADDEPVLYERQRHIGALAHNGPDRVGRLAQPGERPAAQGREGPGEPHGLDDMGGRHEPVLVAQESGDLGHPPFDRPVGGAEEVPVPTGRVDPRPVTAVPGEPPMGPGHPGQLGLDLGQPLEKDPVGGDGRPRFERGHMPGSADDDHIVPELLSCGAQLDPHVRLADCVTGVPAVPVHLTQGRHRLAERGERGPRVDEPPVRCPVLDDVFPPALGVVVPGGLGKDPDGVDRRRGHRPVCVSVTRSPLFLVVVVVRTRVRGVRHGQGVRRGQVDEADRHVVAERPADRDPLGRELGERPERRPARVVHRMGEQRHRWSHPLVGGERQQCVALGRPLDEDGPRSGRIQRGTDRAGRSGTVVPDPEQQRPGGGRGPGHAETSRQAR